MSLSANEHSDKPTASTRREANPRRARARSCRADLLVGALLSTCVLASACGSASARPPAATLPVHALAFVNCMRTHGEPNMPDPVVEGRKVSITIHPGSGINPRSAQFTSAFDACRYLTRGKFGAPAGHPITAADQADYLKAVVCMRSHGFPKFPEPDFQNDNVTFNSSAPINTHSAQFQRALAICDKLMPAGLPYSGRNPSTP